MTTLGERIGSTPSVVVLTSDELAASALSALLTSAGVVVERPDQPSPSSVALIIQPHESTWDQVAQWGLSALLLTDEDPDDHTVVTSVLHGAGGLLRSDCSADELIETIRTLAIDGSALSPRHTTAVLSALRRRGNLNGPVVLTPREHQILDAIAAGESVKQTARRLGVSPRTIDNTQRVMFLKLGVRNRAHAVSRAHDLGLLDPEKP